MVAALWYVVFQHEKAICLVIREGGLEGGQDRKRPYKNFDREPIVSRMRCDVAYHNELRLSVRDSISFIESSEAHQSYAEQPAM